MAARVSLQNSIFLKHLWSKVIPVYFQTLSDEFVFNIICVHNGVIVTMMGHEDDEEPFDMNHVMSAQLSIRYVSWCLFQNSIRILLKYFSESTATAESGVLVRVRKFNLKKMSSCTWIRYKTKFDTLAILGKGTFGCVFMSRNKLDKKKYAVKRIPLRGRWISLLKLN